ncbi:MAG TPA: ABC transporter substrate-binding protein [Xanthobacteraceae bacterium]|nr:ABC transporter substrate-binding protein [Xanthobacteraceae bacterium]
MQIHRRTLLKGAAAAGLTLAAPTVLRAQSGPMRIGFLTVKTGPLASGGIQMEEGLTLYLKERNNMLAGRPVELHTGDSAGAPAVARTKMQELVERDNISCLIGPLATAEALAIDDYIREKQIPTLSVAAAEDMTQRKANPWFVRATSSSAQCSYPMGDYAAKELKYKRVAMLADDIAYGYELNAGFQRAFEDAGGKVVQKMWPPLNAPDYGTYIAQLKPDVDALFLGFAGSNGLKFLRQYKEYGGAKPLLGGMTAIDESLLKQMGDEALGALSTCWYSAELDNASNKKLVADMERDYKVDPGFYAAATYTNAAVLEAALKSIGGRIEDKDALIKALRATDIQDTCRGPVKFDSYGNVVGNVYIRKVEKKNGKLVNAVIKTYPNVSQFWTYNPDDFLKHPVYNRDTYPENKYLEQ